MLHIIWYLHSGTLIQIPLTFATVFLLRNDQQSRNKPIFTGNPAGRVSVIKSFNFLK